MPIRIQRRRQLGWRMPEGAVYVGRHTIWGNPYIVGVDGTPAEVVAKFRRLIESHIDGGQPNYATIRRELRGKDLACWCRVEDENGNRVPCHADVLLEIANG